jgi:cytochrome c-type biogenesis protein
MAWTSIGLAFIAGLLSTLSPCVLPLLPIVLGSSISKHKWGPVALALGVSVSFVGVGLFVATVGFAVGIEESVFRNVAAALMLLVGLVLVIPRLESQFAVTVGPVSNWMQQGLNDKDAAGLGSQFGVGLMLGVVWSPCVGPTLGAASLLAAQRQNLGEVALTMLLFGIGAALPMLAISLLSRATLTKWRGRIYANGKIGKRLFGALLIAFSILTLTGLDRSLQTYLVYLWPESLSNLSTYY